MAAAEAMRDAWAQAWANPASQHGPGRTARRRLETARERVINRLGGNPHGQRADRLIFTSGGTEANVLAIRGLLAASKRKRLVISAIEHPSITRTAEDLQASGIRVDRLGVSEQGVTSVEHLQEILADSSDPVGLVSVMLASNETGVLQPVADLAACCREHGVLIHTDAVQAVGKSAVHFRELGVDALTFTGHKFHGPIGIGGLLCGPTIAPEPLLHGGFQQEGLRPGTESTPLVAGLLAALEEADQEATDRWAYLGKLRDQLEVRLLDSWPQAWVLGGTADRLPHATCLAFPGADRQALVMAYDLAGVACSSGSACASGSSEPSPTLLAMGLPDAQIGGAVRFAVGAMTSESDVQEACQRIAAVNVRMRVQDSENA